MKRLTLMAVAGILSLAAVALVATATASPRRDLAGVEATAISGENAIQLVEVMRATIKYHSVAQALADGYVPGSPCESSPAGGMGIHYVNPPLLGDPAIEPTRPEILLYAPDAVGNLRLLGVEYWKADADQSLATDADRPFIFGQPFDGPMLGHAPGMPVHYDLHVWLWKKNPSGLFAPWNPTVICP